jgi:hypothetical protein
MDELDKLKSHWKNSQETFPKVSESQIYAMLHKRSSSIVKWIIIISIIELCFWSTFTIGGSFINTAGQQMPNLITILDYVNLLVLILFVVLFYVSYRKISAVRPVKELLQNIITTRRIVHTYMIYIISVMTISMALVLFAYNKEHRDDPNSMAKLGYEIIAAVVMIGIVILIYNLLYGRLLRKLNKNYKELEKMQDS